MKLYAHQQAIVDEDPTHAGLWLGTGSGKTITALMLSHGNVLVIAPKTQVEDRNWERAWVEVIGDFELNHKIPGRACNCCKGAKKRTLTVMTFDKFKAIAHELDRFDTVIGDEIHGMLGVMPNTKSVKRVEVYAASQRFEALRDYVQRVQPERVYLCSATIVKSPLTVWGAEVILGKHDGSMNDFMHFRYEFYTKLPMPGRQVYVAKKDDQTKFKLAERVKAIGYIGRLDDYFDVPEQTFRTIHVELTKKQEDRIKKLRLEFPEPIVRLGKRLQVENGVLAGDQFNAPERFDNAKVDKILELAEEFPRMIVFAKYTAQINEIQDALTDAGIATWRLTGDTKDRGTVIKEANEADGVLICQAQISAGWEVPNTPVMVFASRTYSFVDYQQALGRILRANHLKKNLYINLVVKGGVDDAVDSALMNKQDFDDKLYAENIDV